MDQLERLRQYRAAEYWPSIVGRAVALLLEPASATTAAPVIAPHPTPPIGTPGAVRHGGNSAPARPLVAGAGKSPGFGPVSGK